MEKITLEIAGITTGEMPGSYKLILTESGGGKRIPIVIGSFEAQAIAIEIERVTTYRPMTHDLFVSFCRAFGIKVRECLIYNLKEGVFFAKLICDLHGEVHEIDSRTSDAVALAVRFRCPIYIYKHIFDEVGAITEEEETEPMASTPSAKPDETVFHPVQGSSRKNDYSRIPVDELEKMLQAALDVEDYDKAAQIRDEITRRKK